MKNQKALIQLFIQERFHLTFQKKTIFVTASIYTKVILKQPFSNILPQEPLS